MNPAPKNLPRADRLLTRAPEPNLSSLGWPAMPKLDDGMPARNNHHATQETGRAK